MDEKRNTPIFLVSLLALQFWSMVFAALTLSNPYVGIPAYQPFGNQTVGDAAANSLSLLLPVLIFTFVLIFVIRMFPNIFRAVVILFPLFGFFIISQTTFFAVFNSFIADVDFANYLGFGLTIFFMVLGVYSIWKKVDWLRTLVTFILAAEFGAVLALSFTPPTLFVFPIAFAIYDIYAVFFGPLKKLAGDVSKGPRKKEKISDVFGFLVSNVGGFNIGTGDLVFYSMIASAAFILKGLLVSVFVVALIEFGTYLTTYLLLKYKRMLPGLPIPIFLGTGALILLYYL